MSKEKLKDYLSNRITLKAKILTDFESLSKKLEIYPNLSLAQEGKQRYKLQIPNLQDRFYILEFESKKINIELYSKISPLYFLQETILRALSIYLFLKNEYIIDLDPLIPYIIEVLSSANIAHYLNRPKLIRPIFNTDLILAKRIYCLLQERQAITRDYTLLKERFQRNVIDLITAKYGRDTDLETLSNQLSMSKPEVTETLEKISEMGYEIVNINKTRFNIIKLTNVS